MASLDDFVATRPNGRPPRIIARSFWGFDPSWASVIGFTLEANRQWFLENYEEGDLALIYCADGEHAAPPEIGKILGLMQVEKRPIFRDERLTEAARAWHKQHGYSERWVFALPMKKAWRVVGNYDCTQVAADTFSRTEGRIRGSRGVVLTDYEALQILKLRVRPTNVYMEPPVYEHDEPPLAPLFSFFIPSSAFPPTGTVTIEDGPRYVYLSEFNGEPHLLLPRADPRELQGKRLIKVGIAKDPKTRFDALNQGFPKASQQFGFLWKAGLQSPSTYPDYNAAVKVEAALKSALHEAPAEVAKSIGGEFFLVDFKRAQAIFLKLTIRPDEIVGASSPVRSQ